MKTESNRPGSLLMLASSMLIFGTIGIFRRNILLSSGLLAFARGAIGAVFLCAVLLIRRGLQGKRGGGNAGKKTVLSGQGKVSAEQEVVFEKQDGDKSAQKYAENKMQKLSGRMLFMLILSGALIGINWILLFESYNYTTVAIATLCYYMLPTIVILVSPFVFGERLTVKKLVCAMIAVLGMVFVSGVVGEGIPQGDALLGIIYGLGAALFYAGVVIMNKKWITNVDPYLKTMIQLASASVCLIPYLFATKQFVHVEMDSFSILMVLIMGLVHTGIAYTLYFGSTDGLKAQTIALVSYIDPVSALIFSTVFLREPLGASGLIGAVLILGAAFAAER